MYLPVWAGAEEARERREALWLQIVTLAGELAEPTPLHQRFCAECRMVAERNMSRQRCCTASAAVVGTRAPPPLSGCWEEAARGRAWTNRHDGRITTREDHS